MVNVKVDKTGRRYGRWLVLEVDETKQVGKQGAYYICKCDCGTIKSVRGNTLGNSSTSCGCVGLEKMKKNPPRYKTGKSHSRLACIWYHIKSRCDNPKDTNYKTYGARGIRVCEEWSNSFESFEAWAVQNGYKEGLTIDRIDPNGNYEPVNCRWITLSEQQNNKRTTLFILHNGEYKSLKQAYKEENPKVSYQTVRVRYNKGERDINALFADRQYRGNQSDCE